MIEHEDRYVAVLEKHTLNGTNVTILMKHKHIGVRSTRMHRRQHDCQGPGVIWAGDHLISHDADESNITIVS